MTTRPARALLALSGLALCNGCIPTISPAAWSPDGSRILFPYRLPEKKGVGIALYDVKKGTTHALRIFSPPWSEIWPRRFSVCWLSDGKRVLALASRLEGLDPVDALILNAESGEVLKHHSLSKGIGLLHPPALLRDRYLFEPFSGFWGDGLLRLDLESGEVKRGRLSGLRHLSVVGDIVYFARERVKRRGVNPFFESVRVEGAEIGKLDPDTLKPNPLLVLSAKDRHGPVLGVVHWGEHMALRTLAQPLRLLVFNGSTLERTIRVEAPDGGGALTLTDQVWSADGNAILVAYRLESTREFGVCELPLDGGRPRFLPLHTEGEIATPSPALPGKPGFYGVSGVPLLLSLSPDGKTLAALHTQLILEEGAEINLFAELFLVDLTSPERTITKVAPPVAPPASERQEGQQKG